MYLVCLGLRKRKGWAMPARLLVVEWPEAFPSYVWVPNSARLQSQATEPHEWSGSRRGPARKLCANRELLQAALGKAQEKQPQRCSRPGWGGGGGTNGEGELAS